MFRQIWCVDFEFIAGNGEHPVPVCMVAKEIISNTTVRLWQDDLSGRRLPPFSTGPDTLFVAYYASAEIGCFLALGWPVPERIMDLFVEFRCHTNGTYTPCGAGLIGALTYFALPAIDAADKDTMRDLVLRGGPWTEIERRDILDYCQSDVDALARLLLAMQPHIDLARALLRGRYMAAAARIERVGIPIDVPLHRDLVTHWKRIRVQLIGAVDRDYGVYSGSTFKQDKFAAWLDRHGIAWPRLPSGRLDLKDDTFRTMAKAYSKVQALQELRATLAKLRLNDLAIGHDGRNRVLLSAFRAASSRNAPSASKFAFGPAVWIRGLIRPDPDRAIAYVDWSQQEFGIAAALSGDTNMICAYQSGDPYLAFAMQAGAVPESATKATHSSERELYKTCALGVQYGMAEYSLAARIGQSVLIARRLLRDHRDLYRRFWTWSDAAADQFAMHGYLHTVFGWQLRNGVDKSDRTARNFPMQGNAAEMMRLAACLMTEAGIEVCAPVHDAFLIEAPIGEIDLAVQGAQTCMLEASRLVLSGFELRSDAKIVRYPDRYTDPRGERMFGIVSQLLAECIATPVEAEPAPVKRRRMRGGL